MIECNDCKSELCSPEFVEEYRGVAIYKCYCDGCQDIVFFCTKEELEEVKKNK